MGKLVLVIKTPHLSDQALLDLVMGRGLSELSIFDKVFDKIDYSVEAFSHGPTEMRNKSWRTPSST